MAQAGSPLKAVVDANVIAYYLLETEPFVQEVREFWRRVGLACAPALWEAELLNVIWLARRAGIIDAGHALDLLMRARGLDIVTVPVRRLWEGTLVRAAMHGHTPYDTVYVELASRLDLPLVTFDEVVLERFPETAVRPGSILD